MTTNSPRTPDDLSPRARAYLPECFDELEPGDQVSALRFAQRAAAESRARKSERTREAPARCFG